MVRVKENNSVYTEYENKMEGISMWRTCNEYRMCFVKEKENNVDWLFQNKKHKRVRQNPNGAEICRFEEKQCYEIIAN